MSICRPAYIYTLVFSPFSRPCTHFPPRRRFSVRQANAICQQTGISTPPKTAFHSVSLHDNSHRTGKTTICHRTQRTGKAASGRLQTEKQGVSSSRKGSDPYSPRQPSLATSVSTGRHVGKQALPPFDSPFLKRLIAYIHAKKPPLKRPECISIRPRNCRPGRLFKKESHP